MRSNANKCFSEVSVDDQASFYMTHYYSLILSILIGLANTSDATVFVMLINRISAN